MRMKILKLAVPSIISNLTVPLMGLFDVSIVGHLSNTSYIGAIAVGGMMFSLLYWGFVFLRMGTGGLTAQAFGRQDSRDISNQLIRPLVIALGISAIILLLHRQVEWLIFCFIGDSGPDVNHWASVYFRICVWGAPAVLSMYAFNGWFVGLQNPKITMYVAIFQNVLNILFSLFFVYVLHLEVEGVAWGTLLGQWSGVIMAIVCCAGFYKTYFAHVFTWSEILDTKALMHYFHVNKNIFGRTLCLVAVTVSFTSFGARQGETMLAVNTLMMQLFTIFSYFMDGFAYAGEALAGAYLGEGSKDKFREMIRSLFFWGWMLMILFVCLYGLGGSSFLGLLTDQEDVLEASMPYILWSCGIPVFGFASFLWDGIYIGMTRTKAMFQVMFIAMVSYFMLYYFLFPAYGNHGLWIAFLSYLGLRGAGLWFLYQKRC